MRRRIDMRSRLQSLSSSVVSVVAALALTGSAHAAFLEAGGQAVMEAENFTSRSAPVDLPDGPTETDPNQWDVIPDEAAASAAFSNARGDRFLQVQDAAGVNGEGNFGDPTAVGPFVDYVVRIATPGIYRLFVRWDSPSGQSDSFYAMLLDPAGDLFGNVETYSGNQDRDFATNPWDQATELWTLGAGDYTVRLAPREEGVAVDALIVQLDSLTAPSGDGPPESATDIDLGTPDIAVSPSSLSFGAVPPGGSATLGVMVSNVGDGDLEVIDIALGGGSSPDFEITSTDGLPALLAPGEMAEIEVTFMPMGTALETATLEIFSDDPDESLVVVDLSGSGDSGDLAQCLEDLAACESNPRGGGGDSDADGESDGTDACADTEAGAAIDQAGCSIGQFCTGIPVHDFVSWLRCWRSDWQNDEPLRGFPRDCRPHYTSCVVDDGSH
jgi:hypothetical protein